VSASGLIYAAIAIMWAAVLIPMWLRNHESATENRSAERFGQAMRVLSRKESSAEGDHDEMYEAHDPEQADARPAQQDRRVTGPAARATEPRPARRKVTVAQSTAQRVARRVAQSTAQREARRQAQREARRQAPLRRAAASTSPGGAPLTLAQRRARTLGVLAGVSLVMIVLSAFTPLPWWVAAPFLLLIVAFVVHLRVQARQQVARRRPTRASTASDARGRRPVARPERVSTPEEAGGHRGDVAEAPSSSDESGVVQGPSRAVVVERKGEGSGSGETHDASDPESWRPNPLPLPTYVTAPKAVRPIKVIDLTTPGAWSSGRLLEDDVAEEDLLAAQVADEELDALIGSEVAAAAETPSDDSRRAVGD
jgi:hypothetical protein